jgi:3-methylcrotonyl-CoA carboxylase beta subunit
MTITKETVLLEKKEPSIEETLQSHLKKEFQVKKIMREAFLLKKNANQVHTRNKIQLLTDSNSSLLELSTLAGENLYKEALPSAGIITCIGKIHGIWCLIIANDSTTKGGTYYPITVKKHLRAQEIAEENRLPCIYLVDSGGANLLYQDEVFPDKHNFGRIFYNQARMSSYAIPQFSAIFGHCVAGGAYIPALSDESIIVKEYGHIFLAGPELVKAATQEIISADELGGSYTQANLSGVVDHVAEDDTHAIKLLRRFIELLPKTTIENRPPFKEPEFDPNNILKLIPTDPRMPFDMHKLVRHLIDRDSFVEFQSGYGQSVMCSWTNIGGYSVACIANTGILNSSASNKVCHFIQLCEQRNIPIVFFQNVTGFMVGKLEEQKGIIKHGAKIITAISTSNVPKITIIVGGSYGAGNYAMCGRSFNPSFLWTWPNAKISVMGANQAAELLCSISNKSKDIRLQNKQKIITQFESQSKATYATARLWDDGIIDPRNTRLILMQALSIINQKNSIARKPTKPIYRV